MNDHNKIIEICKKADNDYYNTGKSDLTDDQYDKFKKLLRAKYGHIREVRDYLKQVGATPSKHLTEVDLIMHMGSQLHSTTDDEFYNWYIKVGEPEVVISDKVDGSSVECLYIDGKLTRVATRGDGSKGNDITANAMKWKNLPKTINVNGQCVVRGEAILFVIDWKTYFTDKANPRNAGNGTILRKDDNDNSNCHIRMLAFDIVHPTESFEKHDQKFECLKSLGFETPRWFVAKDKKQVANNRKFYVEQRNDLPYWIDGMVVAINNMDEQTSLGFADGGKRPKGQNAWKFDSDKGITKVIGMTLTIGHTGAIIPAAKLEPIFLAGTTVQNVLLNNFEYIDELNLNVGDEVEVEKAGDIIPHITKVVKKNSDSPYPRPIDWKGFALKRVGRHLMVTDPDCPDLTYQRVKNWIGKTNIKFIGDEALTAMFEAGIINDISDLYKVTADDLENLTVGNGVLGKSMATKICIEIDKTRKLPTDIFMGSLGVKFLGRQQARNIRYSIPQEYFNVSVDSLAKEEGMGVNKAADMIQSINQRKGLIEILLGVIDVIPLDKPKPNADGPLSGVSFCFTGCRPTKDEEEVLAKVGAIVKSGVSKGLTHLVMKEIDSSSNKAVKAQEYCTKIISYYNFKKLIEKAVHV